MCNNSILCVQESAIIKIIVIILKENFNYLPKGTQLGERKNA